MNLRGGYHLETLPVCFESTTTRLAEEFEIRTAMKVCLRL